MMFPDADPTEPPPPENPGDQPTIHQDRPEPVMEAAQPTQGDAAAPPLYRVGDYELIREIGRGGMGRRLQARQGCLNRTVALKMILGGTCLPKPDDLQVPLRHRRPPPPRSLQHPGNIVAAVRSRRTTRGSRISAMEYVSGSSPGPASFSPAGLLAASKTAAKFLEATGAGGSLRPLAARQRHRPS